MDQTVNNGINWYIAWLWIKVRRAGRWLRSAATQGKPRPSAHTGTTSPVVDDLSTGADVETIRRLYAAGIISRAQFEEGMGMTLLKPEPSGDARPDAPGLMQTMKIGFDPSGPGGMWSTGATGNALRAAAEDQARRERDAARDPDEIRASYRPCLVCGAPGHAGVVHGTVDGIRPHRPMTAEEAALQERAYREMPISPDVIEELRMIQSPERPSEGLAEAPVPRETGLGAPDAPEGRQGAPRARSGCIRDTDGDGNCGQPLCPECGGRVVGEHDPDYNDLQDYLEGDTATAEAAARRLDQRAVDEAQLSPGAYRLQWGVLPVVTFNAHQFWCGRRDHDFMQCPFWGEE